MTLHDLHDFAKDRHHKLLQSTMSLKSLQMQLVAARVLLQMQVQLQGAQVVLQRGNCNKLMQVGGGGVRKHSVVSWKGCMVKVRCTNATNNKRLVKTHNKAKVAVNLNKLLGVKMHMWNSLQANMKVRQTQKQLHLLLRKVVKIESHWHVQTLLGPLDTGDEPWEFNPDALQGGPSSAANCKLFGLFVSILIKSYTYSRGN